MKLNITFYKKKKDNINMHVLSAYEQMLQHYSTNKVLDHQILANNHSNNNNSISLFSPFLCYKYESFHAAQNQVRAN